MAIYLKKAKNKGRVYYQVYDGIYDSEKKNSKHHIVKSIGFHDDLLKQGIEDPLAYAESIKEKYKEEYESKMKQVIDDNSPIKNYGYVLIKAFFDKLNIDKDLNYFNINRKVKYKLNEILRFLVYAQIISPGSKRDEFRNFKKDLPIKFGFEYDQILDALEVLGKDYPSVISIINAKLNSFYKKQTDCVYFDGTNFYFEIDKPYDDKQKGPSKENRNEPIIGMGLLLDKNQLPLSMMIYPGNESEKPKIRQIIRQMKEENEITGKTIQIADKGLNCGQNIFEAVKNKDGYIYSQSIKMLSQKEKTWVLNEKDYIEIQEDGETTLKMKECIDEFEYKFEYEGKSLSYKFKQKRVVYWSKQLYEKQTIEIKNMIEKAKNLTQSGAKKSEFGECAKYLKIVSVDENGVVSTDNIEPLLNIDKIKEDLSLCGYNMLITSETSMKSMEIYKAYKNLWRIEETFRILKTDLQIRPVFLQIKKEIYGHFLIGYIAVLFIRYMELVVFNDELPVSRILNFIRGFKGIMSDLYFINCTKKNMVDDLIANKFSVPILRKQLTPTQIEKLQNYKL